MSPQLLSEYFGGRNNTVHAHHGASSGDADNHSTPPEVHWLELIEPGTLGQYHDAQEQLAHLRAHVGKLGQ